MISPVGELTDCDVEIFCHVCRRWRARHGYGAATRWLIHARDADRDDAKRLLRLQRYKAVGTTSFLMRCAELFGFGGLTGSFINIPQRDARGNVINYL